MIIDRFEGGIAVVETDSGMLDIARELLPENTVEGDVIVLTDGGYIIDEQATAERHKTIAERFRRLTGGAE